MIVGDDEFQPTQLVFENTHNGACAHNDAVMHVCGKHYCIASVESMR